MPDVRVGLTERELRAWIERLRSDKRAAKIVADQIERAVDAALAAGMMWEERRHA